MRQAAQVYALVVAQQNVLDAAHLVLRIAQAVAVEVVVLVAAAVVLVPVVELVTAPVAVIVIRCAQ